MAQAPLLCLPTSIVRVQGRDVIAQAQSGTGKTSLIAITLCQMLDTTLRE